MKTPKEAIERVKKLREQIEDWRYRYHVLDDPTVTDDVFDSLQRELKILETEYPELDDPNSPTKRVGGKPLDKFVKVKHEIRMVSLNDAFSFEELEAWEKRIKKLLSANEKIEYFCELKLDGLSVSLIYENGEFKQGSTRGDGLVGEDVTQNLKTIQSIPLKLKKPFPDLVEVRGEGIMSKKTLENLNKKYEKEGKPLLANTRNAAAGSLRQLDPQLAAERKLDFFGWDIARARSMNHELRIMGFEKHSNKHKLLKELGFKIDKHEKICKNLDEVKIFIEEISKIREKLPYGTDGVVVSVNDLSQQEKLGIVGKAPRYMVAFKYPAEKATTIIKNILFNVGRTGVLTPVAIFEPTLVAGSLVSKATLHNMDQIERLGVKIGDTVIIQKAGDVIPEVVQVLEKMRNGKEKKIEIPKICPICGEKVEQRGIGEKKEKSVALYCINSKCPAKNRRGMQHFVNAIELYTIGPKILDRFKEENLISDAADIFALRKEDINTLERFGEKSAENIITSINEHKKIPLWRFIYALGILHVGEQTAQDLAEFFKTFEKLMGANEEEISAILNIGPIVAKSVSDFFRQKENIKLIEKFFKNGIKVLNSESEIVNQGRKFDKKIFVLTGTLINMSRDEAKAKIRENGGKITESVSKEIDYVVVGENPGSKYEKAQKLGVKILNETDFQELLKA